MNLTGSPALFLDSIDKVAPHASGVFFDEIQHMEEAGLFLKGLSDLKIGKPIVATGSSSFHLRSKTRESLAGRAERHLILPFGFEEVRPAHRAPAVQAAREHNILEELLVWGGILKLSFRMKDRRF